MPTSLQESPFLSIFSLILNSELLRWLLTEIAQLWHQSHFHGMYKVEDHHSTLELIDDSGRIAIYNKRQQVEFLQDGIFAIQDQAWGDGDLFAEYKCSPGVAVDRYKEGYRWKILISLRSTRSKGEREIFVIERKITDGFTTSVGNFQTQVDHPTKALSISVIFPAGRHPKSVTAIEQNLKRMFQLGKDQIIPLSGERVQYQWQVHKPRLYEAYILRWEW